MDIHFWISDDLGSTKKNQYSHRLCGRDVLSILSLYLSHETKRDGKETTEEHVERNNLTIRPFYFLPLEKEKPHTQVRNETKAVASFGLELRDVC